MIRQRIPPFPFLDHLNLREVSDINKLRAKYSHDYIGNPPHNGEGYATIRKIGIERVRKFLRECEGLGHPVK